MGIDQATGQPIPTCTWIDRLAPQAWAVVAAGTCAAYGGIHAMEGNPTGCMGLPDYLGWDWQSKAGIPIVCVPGCPVQPDNFMEVLLYLLKQAAGRAPMIPLDEHLRPTWLFGQTVHEGCDRGGYYEQADFAAESRLAQVHRQARLLGAGRAVQRRQARLDGRHRRLPQRRRRLHRLHHARLSRQVHAVPGRSRPAPSSRPTAVVMYGKTIRALRQFTQASMNREPEWRTTNGTVRDRRLPMSERRLGESADDDRPSRRSWSRCRGTRSPGSSAAWAFTPRSISPTGGSPSATAPRRSSAATASS